MEMKLIEKNNIVYTRFKINLKEINKMSNIFLISLGIPVKTSSKFHYYEKQGDFLNNKKRRGLFF